MNPRKQILLVEPDAALRTEAEKIMRQAGHEVVSVDTAARAEGILTVSQFDLAVIGLNVQGANNTPFYQNWAEDSQRAGAPFLLLCGENESSPGLPEEALVRCPFVADDLLTKVNVFTGAAPVSKNPAPKDNSALFGEDAVEGALDKALGLDQIDVHESEVRGTEESAEVKTVAQSENLVGYDAEITSVTSTQKSETDTSKIDLAFIQNKLRDKPAEKAPVPESARLDIAPVKAALEAKSEASPGDQPSPTGDHDYEWFMSEMQSGRAKSSVAKSKPAAKSASSAKSSADKSTPASADDSVFDWSDSPASTELAGVFSAQLADAVARRVAERLVKQLNSDKFLQLIHQEIQACLKKRS